MSNEISVTFNLSLQIEIPAGQEIKGVSVSFGQPQFVPAPQPWPTQSNL